MKNLLLKKISIIGAIAIQLILVTNVLFANELSNKLPFPPGTYSIGPSGSYSSISNAITAINSMGGITSSIILELNAAYGLTTETLTAVIGASSTSTITIRPAISVVNTISSSSNTTSTLFLNGCSFFIIDGQSGGVGGGKNLTIINTGGIAAVRFQNDASNNVIKNCVIKGQSTSTTNGVIFFSTATALGNDNNTVTNCNITSVGSATLATNAVYSAGTAFKTNDANTISNCNIFDIFHASQKSVGILMAANTIGWNISGNSFYQTANRTSSNICEAIDISNITTGNAFNINNNFIGGSAPLAAGSASTYTFTSTGYFTGINISGFSGAANVVNANTIKNISITCDQTNLHYGIYHSDGTINITYNTIGDLTTTGSIVFNSNKATVSFVSPAFTAICAGGGATAGTIGGNINIQNNNIGSITSNATSITAANELRGIFYQGSAALVAVSIIDISANTVGGTTANSLYNTGNGATVGIVVNSGYTTGGAKHTVKNNIVQNISSSNSTTNAATPKTQGSLEGITTQGTANANAAYIVDNNTIKDLTANNAYTMVGFKTSATIAPQLITRNKIFNLRNASNLVGSNVVGIELGYDFVTIVPSPSATPSELSRNIITNLEMTAAAPAIGSVAWGISAYAGRFNIQNNMVSMGYGIGNADITKPYEIIGISNNGVWASKPSYFNFYYNTVHVGGTGAVSGSPDSKCYFGNNYGSSILQNNIFYNSRSNVSGSTTHYSFYYNNNGTTTSDFNILSAVGTGGMVANNNGTTYSTTDALFAAKAIDGNSFSATVLFTNNATDLRPVPSPDVTNFFIANEALPIAGYTTDIDGNTRNAFFPDMGCAEFKGTGCWIGQTSSAWDNTTVAGNWDDGVIPSSTWDVKIFPNVDPSITQPIITNSLGIATAKDIYFRTTTRSTTNKSLLTINTGYINISGDIKFRNNIEYNGAIDARYGTVEMEGLLPQTLSPKWFVNTLIETLVNCNDNKLVINPPTVNDTMLISKALLFNTSNNTETITNDNVTLLSRSSGTARFGEIRAGSGNKITGAVNVERWVNTNRKWRLLSWNSNSTQTAKQSWMEGASPNADPIPNYGTIVTDEKTTWASNGFDSRSVSGPSVKYYDVTSNGFIGIPNTTSYNMGTKSAYYNFVRGNRASMPINSLLSTTILRNKGPLKTGTQSFAVQAAKFEMIGNPYASSIDIRKLNFGIGISPTLYVWDPKLTGAFGLGAYQLFTKSGTDFTIMPGGGSYGIAGSIVNEIESGMGFLIRGNGSGGNLTIDENAKLAPSTNVFSRGANTSNEEKIYALLYIKENGATELVDGVMAIYDDIYSKSINYEDDLKLNNTNENVSIKRDNILLSIERRSEILKDDTLYLNLANVRVKNYQWAIQINKMISAGRTAYLVDSYNNTNTNLNLDGTTNYSFNIVNIPGSYATDRFKIIFKQIVQPISYFTKITAIRKANKNIEIDWSVMNEQNINGYTIEQSNDGINFINIASKAPIANNNTNTNYNFVDSNATSAASFYRVKYTTTNLSIKYTSVAMVSAMLQTMEDVEKDIIVYPNPAINNEIKVHFINQENGIYQLMLTNELGAIIIGKQVQISNIKDVDVIQLNSANTGVYQLTVISPSNKKNVISILFKR